MQVGHGSCLPDFFWMPTDYARSYNMSYRPEIGLETVERIDFLSRVLWAAC